MAARWRWWHGILHVGEASFVVYFAQGEDNKGGGVRDPNGTGPPLMSWLESCDVCGGSAGGAPCRHRYPDLQQVAPPPAAELREFQFFGGPGGGVSWPVAPADRAASPPECCPAAASTVSLPLLSSYLVSPANRKRSEAIHHGSPRPLQVGR